MSLWQGLQRQQDNLKGSQFPRLRSNSGKEIRGSQSKSWPQVAGHAFSPVEQLGSHRLFGSAQRKTGSRYRGLLHSFHTMHCAGPQTARHNLATEHDTARCNTRAQSLTCVRLFAVPWAGAPQAPLSTGFPRQEYWSGLPCPPPWDRPHPRTELMSLASPAWADACFIARTTTAAYINTSFLFFKQRGNSHDKK